MDELKPCPTCKSTDPVKRYYSTRCRDCGATAPNDRWNTRPIEDALRAENAELRARAEAAEKELGELNDIIARLLGEPAMKAFIALCAAAPDQKGDTP